jgi:hypothetical protein
MRKVGEERKKHYRMLLQWKHAMRQAREEVDLTRSNYSQQLRLLTEHSAGLAQELQAVQDELDAVRAAAATRPG